MLGRGPAGAAMATALALVAFAVALSVVVPYAAPGAAYLAAQLALLSLLAAGGAMLVAAALSALGRGSLGDASPFGLSLMAAPLVLGLLFAALRRGVVLFLAVLAVAVALGTAWWYARSRRP